VSLPNRIVRGRKGAGLAATRGIARGEVVAEFLGEIRRLEEIPEAEMPYVLWLGEGRWMIPRSSGRFINHGCDPNCGIVDRPDDPDGFDVVARRAIRAGEELTFAYNLVAAAEWAARRSDPEYRFWHPSWSFDCLCGAADCQGRVVGYRIVMADEALASEA
jgi:SET domain-containing protein